MATTTTTTTRIALDVDYVDAHMTEGEYLVDESSREVVGIVVDVVTGWGGTALTVKRADGTTVVHDAEYDVDQDGRPIALVPVATVIA